MTFRYVQLERFIASERDYMDLERLVTSERNSQTYRMLHPYKVNPQA